jgi:hypothetical protein
MKKLTYFFASALLLLAIGFGTVVMTSATSPNKKLIKIKNTTDFNIDEIYISPNDEAHWGSDILDPNEILTPGEVITLEVDCGEWDVKLVAEDNSECIVQDVDICASAQWNITADCGK